ncbi:MAG: carboxymuconolactone decarboxylase family protein [Succinatimonas sp.]|nr:carboxymuconolactone decarboxylase family protein [Succinatimonas sp.]
MKLKILATTVFCALLCNGANADAITGDLSRINSSVQSQIRDNVSLDINTQYLVKTATLSVLYNSTYFDDCITEAIANKVPVLMLRESLMQGAPYVGISSTQTALERLSKVITELKLREETPSSSTVNQDTRFNSGLDIQKFLFGDAITTMHQNAQNNEKLITVDMLTAYCFGDFYTRSDLSLKERELLTFVYITALGAHQSQLQVHIQANLKVGNSKDILIDTLKVMTPYLGFPRTLTALDLVKKA